MGISDPTSAQRPSTPAPPRPPWPPDKSASNRLRGWAQGLSRSDGGGLSNDPGAVVPGAYGTAFAELCRVEGTQSGGGRFEADLSGGHGGRGGAGVEGL